MFDISNFNKNNAVCGPDISQSIPRDAVFQERMPGLGQVFSQRDTRFFNSFLLLNTSLLLR